MSSPRARPHVSALGGFVDSLIQTFENRRSGLPDQATESQATAFFTEIYDKELPRLAEMVGVVVPGLSRSKAEAFYKEVDHLIRQVVIAGYVRHAVHFTPRERNHFYLVKENLRAAERAGWTVFGMALGGFVVWAPFIPLWDKYWVLPFAAGGFFFPDVRKYFAYRRYEKELNKIVEGADAEIQRINIAYLTSDVQAEAAHVEAVHDTRPGNRQKDQVH